MVKKGLLIISVNFTITIGGSNLTGCHAMNHTESLNYDRFYLPYVPSLIREIKIFLDTDDKVNFFRKVRDRYNGRLNVIIRHNLQTGHMLAHEHPLGEREGFFIKQIIHNYCKVWSEEQIEARWEHLVLEAIK